MILFIWYLEVTIIGFIFGVLMSNFLGFEYVIEIEIEPKKKCKTCEHKYKAKCNIMNRKEDEE